jgi:hemolysin D
MAALLQQRAETAAEYQKGVLSDLASADQKIDEAAQDLVKARQQVALTTLTAPIAGTLQQLAVHTLGGVVSPGQALLTIAPDNQQLMVEASVQNQDIGFVHVGQGAEIKIGAFDFTRFGMIKGTVVSISRDVVDEAPNQAPQNDGYQAGADPDAKPQNAGSSGVSQTPQEPGYVAHIALDETSLVIDTGTAELQPGMAVTADIQTGKRRVIGFLLAPFAHQIEEAGHER